MAGVCLIGMPRRTPRLRRIVIGFKFDLIVIKAALHVWYVATDRYGLERREPVDPSLRITSRLGNSCCILERYDPARMARRSRAYSLDALAKPSRQLRGGAPSLR